MKIENAEMACLVGWRENKEWTVFIDNIGEAKIKMANILHTVELLHENDERNDGEYDCLIKDNCNGFVYGKKEYFFFPKCAEEIPDVKPRHQFLQMKYLQSGGTKCPYCGCDAIEGTESVQTDASIGWRHIFCTECEKEWNERFKLVGVAFLQK